MHISNTTAEILYDNINTTERLVKIVEGLWAGTIRFVEDPDNGRLACQIGEQLVRFHEDDEIEYEVDIVHLKVEDIKKYPVFDIAYRILAEIMYSKEYDRCRSLLGLNSLDI
jgi:hypothetical protein